MLCATPEWSPPKVRATRDLDKASPRVDENRIDSVFL
jgi:hypothetical protein